MYYENGYLFILGRQFKRFYDKTLFLNLVRSQIFSNSRPLTVPVFSSSNGRGSLGYFPHLNQELVFVINRYVKGTLKKYF